MSREDFSGFVQAAKRSISLREEIRKCKDWKMFMKLAKEYGFSISSDDLNSDKDADRINKWFLESQISPLRKL